MHGHGRSPVVEFSSVDEAALCRPEEGVQTDAGQRFIFPGSAPAAEASLTNTLSPGDKVLSAASGQFSTSDRDGVAPRSTCRISRRRARRRRRGLPGAAADAQHQIKAVMIVHNETATGVTSDIGAIARPRCRKTPAMPTSTAQLDRRDRFPHGRMAGRLRGDRSQKALMLPPGAAIVCVSQKALAAGEHAKLKRAFFEFKDQINQNANGSFPYTPSIPMLHGLRESLAILLEEGLDNVYARHHRLAGGVRAAVKAWGLELCARSPKSYSDTVSAVMVPSHIKSDDVMNAAYKRYNLSLGAGLSKLAGKLFRIGHMGDLNELMLLGRSAERRWRCATPASRSRLAAAWARPRSSHRRAAPAAAAVGAGSRVKA
jgi:alanine-glyoxylate transaminase/serine-glyoxylate transaminase/serine-pyruvate transaminase